MHPSLPDPAARADGLGSSSAFGKCGQLPGEFLWQLQENSRNYPLPDCGGKERFSFGGFSFYVEKQQDLPGSGGGFWLGEQRYAGTEELLFNKERTLAQEMELRRIFMEDGF